MGIGISGIAKSILGSGAELKASFAGKEDERNVSIDFMQMMSQSQLSPRFSSNADTALDVGRTGAMSEAGESAREVFGNYASSGKAVTVQESSAPKEAPQEAPEALETYKEEIRRILKEELGVTEEEIADAMEALGISFADLGNPKDLAALVQELTGEEIGALFLSDSFQSVMEQTAVLTEALRAELGVAAEEWDAFCETWEQMERGDVPEMEVSADMQLVPETETVSAASTAGSQEESVLKTGLSANDAAILETELAADDAAVLETEFAADDAAIDEPVTVATEDGQPVENDAQEAENAMARAAAVSGEESRPEQEAADSKLNHEQDRAEGAERMLSDMEPHGEETDAHSGTGSGGQSLFGHARETKTHDAGIGLAAAGQQTVRGEEFAVQAEAQPAYSSQIDAIDLIEQIAKQVRVTVSAEATSMEMQLNPEHLGKIYLNISEKEGAVRAQIAAQNEAVKEALETQVAELRQSLHQQGIKVDAIEVTVATHEFEQNLEQNARQEEQMRQQREEVQKQARRNLNLNDLDGLTGLMSEEEELAARIMKDNGNQVDLTA